MVGWVDEFQVDKNVNNVNHFQNNNFTYLHLCETSWPWNTLEVHCCQKSNMLFLFQFLLQGSPQQSCFHWITQAVWQRFFFFSARCPSWHKHVGLERPRPGPPSGYIVRQWSKGSYPRTHTRLLRWSNPHFGFSGNHEHVPLHVFIITIIPLKVTITWTMKSCFTKPSSSCRKITFCPLHSPTSLQLGWPEGRTSGITNYW